ncbi:VENN motif pre-toxin domain-containing protein [Rahnella sikkimica]|uniref:VENN motif-containing domain-containing protein n=1 Tax=Rahnella sikkimica TaxID=1805933 RepID=A0A2L1UXQ0_9GAMM|nr:VENN motif pre-toxin domain-containing protein [Rahnella sikkimica]AVF37733.1 hypothetical protein BV494_22730 [Rahnella sikkimica]
MNADGSTNVAANAMAHAVWGAVAAQMSGGNAAAGAAGAFSGELAARYIAEYYYHAATQADIDKLTQRDRQEISLLSTLAAGVAGATAGNNLSSATTGAQAGKNAVENNMFGLHHEETEQEKEWLGEYDADHPVHPVRITPPDMMGVGISGSSIKIISVDKGKYPESAQHIEDAQNAGQPTVLTIDRGGASMRRKESLKDTPTVPGLDRDEYPPAMFEQGGGGASVRPINPSNNRGAGACIGAQCRNLPDGTSVIIKTK